MTNDNNKPAQLRPSDCSAIVLGAGLSTRMGAQNKLTLSVHGMPLLRYVVNAITDAGVNQVVLVLGHEQDVVESSLDLATMVEQDSKMAEQDSNVVSIVVNPHYEKGQATSVTCGLRSLSETTGPTIICLGDQPLIKSAHILALIDTFNQRGSEQVVIPRVNGQRGNPIIISEQVRHRVLAQKHNPGCRQYIDKHPEELLWLDSEEKAYITDLDTPDDVQNYLRSTESTIRTNDGNQ